MCIKRAPRACVWTPANPAQASSPPIPQIAPSRAPLHCAPLPPTCYLYPAYFLQSTCLTPRTSRSMSQPQPGTPLAPASSRQGPPRVPRPPAQAPADPLGLSLEDQVLRPLAYELVLASPDLDNTALISRHNGSPPWFEVHTFVKPPSPAEEAPPPSPATGNGTGPGTGTEARPASRVTRVRRRPHHRQPNDGDVLCLLVAVSDADRDMTIQFPGQPVPVKVRKFFKKGLINSDVYAFADARGNKWEWRERRYGYDLSLHEADKPDYHVIARYTSGVGTSNRPYIEYSPQGHLMLDLVVATFFALENSMRALNARPSMFRALSRVGSILRSPGPGEGSRHQPPAREEQAVAPEDLLPPIPALASLRTSLSTPPPVSPAGSVHPHLPEPRRSMQRQRE
ncbi:hypothetical protein CALVIDRAFT_309389 [Calocera viscosa TUFC12733]|uniref:DUF6593 domain-containing protein n=1 Tax=Calocera viscosa (strain TUFC12733) TaxID=1330018 RepID=A0A167I868_CALVF|nr:hypothetical protein CALVIDRAFT_309389 [Calocera viscosa TUFC12733]